MEANPSLTPCLEDANLDMEMGNKLMETPNLDGIEWSILHSNSGIIPEPDIDMDTSTALVAQKQQGPQQNNVANWHHRELIKRSQRDIPFVYYEELNDDLDELDQSKCC